MVNKKPSKRVEEEGGGSAAPLPSSPAPSTPIPLSEVEYDLKDLSGISTALTRINRRLVKMEVFVSLMQQRLAEEAPALTKEEALTMNEVKLVKFFLERKLGQVFQEASKRGWLGDEMKQAFVADVMKEAGNDDPL